MQLLRECSGCVSMHTCKPTRSLLDSGGDPSPQRLPRTPYRACQRELMTHHRPGHVLNDQATTARRDRDTRVRMVSRNSTLRGTAEEDKAKVSNGSSLAIDDVVPAGPIKGNGSALVPQQGNGDNNGAGSGGGGPGDGRGRGDDDPNDDPDPQAKALLLLLTVIAAGASLYGVYHLVFAVRRLITQRQATTNAAQPESRSAPSALLQLDTSSISELLTRLSFCRSHNDIAALKRLLRELFTSQLQLDRRISALEPEKDTSDAFDTLTRSRKGWQAMSGTGKAKVELSGSLVMGSAMLFSKVSLMASMQPLLAFLCLASVSQTSLYHQTHLM